MKKIVFGILLLSATTTFAQSGRTNRDRNQPANEAPATIQQSFHRDHPNVKDASWSQSNRQWRANYRDNNNRNVDSYYKQNGNRQDTHTAWDKKDVPSNIDNRVNSRYNANGNYTATRIERPNSKPLFQIRIQTGNRDHTVYMDDNAKHRRYNDHH